MTIMKMAILKETGKPITGKRGQYAEGKTFGGSLHHTGRKREEYEFVNVDISAMDGVRDYQVIPKPGPGKEFNVTMIHSTNWNDEGHVEILVNNGNHISIGSLSECPEDASLERDLYFVYDIPDLMRMAHEAGRKGIPFVVEHKDEEDEE